MSFIAALALLPAAAATPVPVTGMWLTPQNKVLIQIAPCGAQICGRIVKVFVPWPDMTAVDHANRDPAQQHRPIEGLPVLTGFRPDGNHWSGRVYDPESGREFRSELMRHGDTLDVKGCFGPFCLTKHWTPAR